MARMGAGVLVAAALLSSGAAWARGGPDLVVASLTDPPLTVVAGGTVAVTEAVRNSGGARARASSVRYLLSTDSRAGKGDVRLPSRRAVGALAPRKRSRRTLSLRVPGAVRAGAYHVIACADATAKVRERSERNNCRASRGRVAVALRPRPLKVTPVLDTPRAVSGTVGAQGGVLTATAANGATLSLDVAAGSLLSDVTITMTPLSGVTGLPFPRGLVAAVELAPEGLRFLAPATLTVTPTAPVAVGDQAGFSYRGDGEGFHLQRSRPVGNAIALTITHFSGAGVAQGSGPERASVADANPPADAVDQAEQQAAVPVGANPMDAAVMGMYAAILAMAQDRLTIDQAIVLYNAWYGTALGTNVAGLWPALHSQLTVRILQFVAQARAACAAQPSLDEAGWILRLGNQSLTLVPAAANVVQAATEALTRCVRFELDVTADLANNLELDRGRMKARVSALPVAVVSGFTPDRLSGSKTIEVLEYRIDDFDCWVHTWNPQPVLPLRVLSLKLSGLNPGTFGLPAPVRVEALAIDPGIVDDQVTHTCGGDGFTNSMEIWNASMPSLVGGGSITSWAPVSQGAWRREYQRPASPGEPSGTVTFDLRHAPLP